MITDFNELRKALDDSHGGLIKSHGVRNPKYVLEYVVGMSLIQIAEELNEIKWALNRIADNSKG